MAKSDKSFCTGNNENIIKGLESYKCNLNPWTCGKVSTNKECQNILKPCKRVLYNVQTRSLTSFGLTSVMIRLKTDMVTYFEEYFLYDLESFLGDTGGILGSFLGLSFMSLFELERLARINLF